MLSQDNSPFRSKRPKSPVRTIIGGLSAVTLACFGLLATTTQLQWQLPSLDKEDVAALSAEMNHKKVQTIAARAIKVTTPVHHPRKAPYKSKSPVAPLNVDFQSVKLLPAPTPAPKSSPSPVKAVRRIIKQPGDNIIINQLPDSHTVPVSSGGMPKFYKIVLKPKGKKTEFGLMQHTARKNFGYDHQDIFTGEVPDGAYVIHCHRSEKTAIRAMCWRELQVSDNQWVQYRFPRAQLKDWWKIEQKVRANIG